MFPNLMHGLEYGFDVEVGKIYRTFAPENKISTHEFAEQFDAMVDAEFDKGRYLGPFSKRQVEHMIGPFQTSSLHIISKPNKSRKFRLIQDLLFPHNSLLSYDVQSVNSSINSTRFPCMWGTFNSISFSSHSCLLGHKLLYVMLKKHIVPCLSCLCNGQGWSLSFKTMMLLPLTPWTILASVLGVVAIAWWEMWACRSCEHMVSVQSQNKWMTTSFSKLKQNIYSTITSNEKSGKETLSRREREFTKAGGYGIMERQTLMAVQKNMTKICQPASETISALQSDLPKTVHTHTQCKTSTPCLRSWRFCGRRTRTCYSEA